MLPIVEEIAGVVHCKPQVGLTPHDRVQQRTVEQHTDIPVPRVFKECIEVVRLVPQERMQRRTAGCMVDVPFLQDGDAGDTGETVRMGAWSEESYKPATQALGPRLRRMQSLAVQAWALPKRALGEISWKWCMSFLRHGSSGVSWSTLSTFPCRRPWSELARWPISFSKRASRRISTNRMWTCQKDFSRALPGGSSVDHTAEIVTLASQEQSSQWIFWTDRGTLQCKSCQAAL